MASMEIEPGCQVVAPKDSAVASVSVTLHPLVIMNVSDHWTRTRAQHGVNKQVHGVLIGKQTGRMIEVMNSFDVIINIDPETRQRTVDGESYANQEEQYQQVFPDLDLVGWYSTGSAPTSEDIEVHKQIGEICEGAVMFMLDPLSRAATLPVVFYESIIDTTVNPPITLFVEVNYTLHTEDGERIGIDHITRISTIDQLGAASDTSAATSHLMTQYSAVKMLYNRIQILKSYVLAVEKGEIPVDHAVLRECRSLVNRLPLVDDNIFKQQFYEQCNDVELMTYLGTITQGCKAMNQFVTSFNILHDRYGAGGGRRLRALLP